MGRSNKLPKVSRAVKMASAAKISKAAKVAKAAKNTGKWAAVKSMLKKAWKASATYITGAIAGYEINDAVHGLMDNDNTDHVTQQQVFGQRGSSDGDDFGANEIIIILLAIIVVLMLLILIVIAGIKAVSMISRRAVRMHNGNINRN